MSEVESTIFDVCNPTMNDFHDEDFLEPAEIFFLNKNLEENENEFLELISLYVNEEADSSFFLLEVLGNLNYLPSINILSKALEVIKNKLSKNENIDEKWYKNILSIGIDFAVSLIRLNSSKGLDFLSTFFDELDEWSNRNLIELLFNINNKLAIEAILKLVGCKAITNEVYLDKINNYLNEIKIKESKLNSLIKFSIEIQIERYDLRRKDELFNSLKKVLEKNQVEVIFRSFGDNIGGFSSRRTRIYFDLFSNTDISAKEIIALFGNNSILYLSGNTQIDGKNVFYENAAWYRENENMSEEDKVFWDDSSIVKFRVYNVVHGL